MTASAGLDILAALGAQPTAPGMPSIGAPKAGATANGAGKPGVAASTASTAAGSFRTGFQAMLSSLEEASSTPAPGQSTQLQGADGKNSANAVSSHVSPAAVSASVTANPDVEQLESVSQAASKAHPATKTARVLPAELSANASSAASKETHSTTAHSTRVVRHSSASAKASSSNDSASQPTGQSSGQLMSMVQPALPVAAPVVVATPSVVHTASLEKTTSVQASASFLQGPTHAAQDKTNSAVALPAYPSSSAESAATFASSVADADPRPSSPAEIAAETYAAGGATAASASHAVASTSMEQNPAEHTGQSVAGHLQALTRETASGNAAAAKASNDAVPASGGIESVASAPHANGGPKLRDRAPLAHESANETGNGAGAVPQGSASTASTSAGTALIRDSAGIQTAPGNSAAGTAHAAADVHEAFAALDAAPGQPETSWLHASARHAEAGYLDPSLGWISVRADATSNGLHASLVPSSPEAAQALSTHLAGLNSYLAAHHGSTITASLAAPQSSANSQQAAGGMGQNPGQGSSNQQQNPGGAPTAAFAASTPSAAWTGSAQEIEPATIMHTRTGGISVVA